MPTSRASTSHRGTQEQCCEATVTSLTGHEGTVQAALITSVRARHWLTALVFCLQTLSFSGNGYYLASASDDGVVKCGSWLSLPADGLAQQPWSVLQALGLEKTAEYPDPQGLPIQDQLT